MSFAKSKRSGGAGALAGFPAATPGGAAAMFVKTSASPYHLLFGRRG